MIRILKKRLALSTKGAHSFCKGVFFTTLMNMALMLPAVYIFLFFGEYLPKVFNPESPQPHGIVYYLPIALTFMVVMFLIAILQYRNTYTSVYEESASRRISLAEKLRILPLAFFGEKNLSDLTATIMEDNTALEHTFSHAVPQLVASVICLIVIAIGLFVYNWQLSLALFWVVPVAVGILLFSKRKLHNENQDIYLKKREVTEYIQEGLDTIQEIKSYCREETYMNGLDEKLQVYEKQLIRGELLAGGLVNTSQSLLKLGVASVIIVGASMVASGSVALFVYLCFLIIASSIYNPINEVFNNMAALFYLDIRINRMNEMQALPIQVGRTECNPDNYDIVFGNVSFSYESGKPVLKNVSFIARQGKITALVGPSGSGKTTAVKLAARFWDVNSGRIQLGNEDISQIEPETLLKNYSVVFQDVVLFNTSIKENIRIGKKDASDDDIMRVAKLAQCDEFVSNMPEGYDTVIGENGETLSGGERQRISIARALLKNAPVVLLDEATASLDVENETKIQAGISELVRDKTVLVIAHRMRTVANADKIIVLDGGKVVESGSPEDLQKKGGMFAGMMRRQMDMITGDATDYGKKELLPELKKKKIGESAV